MKRLSPRAARPLKIAHLASVALWMGGLAAWLPLVLATEATHVSWLHLRAIAWNVIGWGGIGSFATGLALGGLTTWGLVRRPWTVLKLVMIGAGILFGMFFIEQHLLDGIAAIEAGAADGAIAAHRSAMRAGVVAQLALFLSIVAVAVLKPGEGRSERPPAQRDAPA
ncbi:MAG TPA: hypothetical protein VIL20_29970 [Sandaracinaceae bacterium]